MFDIWHRRRNTGKWVAVTKSIPLEYGYSLKGMSTFPNHFFIGLKEKEKPSTLYQSDRNQTEHSKLWK